MLFPFIQFITLLKLFLVKKNQWTAFSVCFNKLANGNRMKRNVNDIYIWK